MTGPTEGVIAAPAAAANVVAARIRELAWHTPESSAASLHEVYVYAEEHAERAINWYMRKKASKARWSRSLRVAAILLTALGGLAPIVTAARVLPPEVAQSTGQIGYVLLGLAAAAVALDRFFGFSTAWIRYIVAALALQRVLGTFRLDWAMALARVGGGDLTVDQIQLLVQRAKEFVALVDATMELETQEWVVEFRSSLAEIERSVRAQLDATRPGAIDVTVTNGMEAEEGFTVFLDGMLLRTVRGTRYQVDYVFPGAHKLRVSGVIGGRQVEASELVMLAADTVAKVTLALPVDSAQP